MPGQFDESKHKRDEGGRFSVGDRVRTREGHTGTITQDYGSGTPWSSAGYHVQHDDGTSARWHPANLSRVAPSATPPANAGEERRASWPVDRPPNTAAVVAQGKPPGAPPATAPKPDSSREHAMNAAKAIGQGMKPPPGAGPEWGTDALKGTGGAMMHSRGLGKVYIPGGDTEGREAAPAAPAAPRPQYPNPSGQTPRTRTPKP